MRAQDRQLVGTPSPVRITVDTPPGIVEPHQPDSGSNQSGSDSGLGCSNSISSDNSTINQPTHQAAAQNWDSCPLDVNNNDTGASNKPETTTIPFSKSDLAAIDEAGTTCTSESNFHQQQQQQQQPPRTAALTSFPLDSNALDQKNKSDHAPDGQLVQPAVAKIAIKSLLKKPTHLSTARESGAPSLTSDPSQTKVRKHNRNVSFNQTVIVFCEELETPPPNEHIQSLVESSSSFEPPLDYCDLDREIPDSSSPRVDLAQSDAQCLIGPSSAKPTRCSTATECSTATVVQGCPDTFVQCVKSNVDRVSSRRNEQAEDADDYDEEEDDDHDDEDTNLFEQDDNDYTDTYVNIKAARSPHLSHRSDTLLDAAFNRLVSKKGVQNLTNDQIVGLLEDENLLEAFKLNYDDLSENDFPMNHLTSGHGYLCDGAISDYDSDSESSYCHNGNKVAKEKASRSLKQTNVEKDSQNQQSTRTSQNKEASTKREEISPNNLQKGVSTDDHSKYHQPNSGSLPARVKMSTVESNHIKKTTSSKDDFDIKLRSVTKSATEVTNKSSLSSIVPNSGGQTNSAQQVLWEQLKSKNLVRDRLIPTETRTGYSVNKAQSLTNSAHLEAISLVPEPLSRCSESADQNQQAHGVSSILNAFPPPPQPLLPTNQPTVNQSACHMCRAIEISRSQANLNSIRLTTTDEEPTTISLADVSQPNKFMTLANQSQPQIMVQSQQPPIFNQSCLSCREASLQQRQQVQAVQPTSSLFDQPQAKPMAYQVVHLVDQNGNRIRALSLIRPGTNGLDQHLVAGRRYVLAQQGPRLANPSSTQDSNVQQQNFIVSSQSNLAAHNQARLGLLNSVSIQQAVPVVNTAQQQPATGLHIEKTTASNHGVRQPGIYYVQQPLETQCQVNPAIVPRSFPDPHEVRRLDGIKAPAMPVNRNEQLDVRRKFTKSVINGQLFEHDHYDDKDDPTFGFSKRPSVKVVAHNLSSGNNLNHSDGYKSQLEISQSDGSIGNRLKQLVSLRPAYVSHTLDRRLTNQNARQDGLLGTNSMTSIQNAHSSANQSRSLQYQQTSTSRLEDQKATNLTAEGTALIHDRKQWTSDAQERNHTLRISPTASKVQ